MHVTHYRVSWIIFTLDLGLSFTDNMLASIPMGTNCAPLVADLILFCFKRFHDNLADIIEAFSTTSRYLDHLLNIDNPLFKGMSIKYIHLNSS